MTGSATIELDIPRRTISVSARNPVSEADMVRVLLRRFRATFPVRAYGTEIRSHGRCRTDICVIARDFGAQSETYVTLGIEAKLIDSKRALRQAILNKYAVDGSLIAMPAGRLTRDVLSIAEDHGIGVLAIRSDGFEVVVAAMRNNPDSTLRARMVDQLVKARPRGRASVEMLVSEVRF